MTDQKSDKTLPGGQEKIVRAVERTLAATTRRERPGVKITNLASGTVQVEVHAYDDDVSTAGDAAREEFDRQMGTSSVPTAELEQLRWLASIGKAHLEGDVSGRKKALEERDQFLTVHHPASEEPPPLPEYKDIPAEPGHRTRASVPATPTVEDTNDLLEKLRKVTDSGVEGVEVSDA
jgi:hypothetical protein